MVHCNCSMFCCALLFLRSSFAIISMGKRELVALLCLSSWCLVIVVWLFLTMPWVCLQFVIVVFSDHTHFFWHYEGCSNMNASSFITFFAYMLQQNGKRFYKGLYVTFKLAPDLKKNSVYLLSYSPLKEGQVSILTNSMLRTYTSDIDERIILR